VFDDRALRDIQDLIEKQYWKRKKVVGEVRAIESEVDSYRFLWCFCQAIKITFMENSDSPKPTKIDLSSLNHRRRDAVISEEKRLLALAGAGSGKRKTLLQGLFTWTL
jgi:hypothetical protein